MAQAVNERFERVGSNVPQTVTTKEVPEVGLEPTRPCGHWILNPARLPIPPLWQRKSANIEPNDPQTSKGASVRKRDHQILAPIWLFRR